MTVIAYKDGIIACDSLWADEHTHSVMLKTKITRLRGGLLYGRAGEGDDRDMRHLLQDVKHPSQLPTRAKLREMKDEYDILLVFPSGSVWVIETGENKGVAEPAPKVHAVGCGADLAIGAMAFGASAKEAVKLACKFNAMCRGPVHSLNLKAKS